ncbi:hypothetical protein [Ruania zhangjianzhongii]|uniref:hypothetical protein n=1 Tax=Ruania zhangjianzhongii TaxID=2603206 RepID=UPI001F17C25E|nr:hypothetical protein [Ruania zhangjianzhongii]
MTSLPGNDALPLTLWPSPADAEQVPWSAYAAEVLDHAGFSYATSTDPSDLAPGGVLLLTAAVSAQEADSVTTWVTRGGTAVLATGAGVLAGSADLAALAGVSTGRGIGSEPVECAPLWADRPPTALRALAGQALHAEEGAEVLATFADGSAAITRRRVGAGLVFTFGVDLWYTIVRIQQGYPVTADGIPAADGTAPIDDGLLKAEDGMALDLETDRSMPPGYPALTDEYTHTYPPPAAVPIFGQPHADWWRSLLLQTLWQGIEHSEAALVWLDYWPAGIDAVAHMSHDADGNDPEDGRAALDAFAAAEVAVTWHQVFPGGYDGELFEAIAAAGHEHALHYNAMADTDLSTWGWPQLRAQYAWAQAVTGRERIVSNKNHYTRWQGWTEFYTWCERVGLQIDSSRGPSKQGTVGFPFGTAHVSYPLTPAGNERRFHNVLNLPLHTQDLAWAGHIAVRDVILDGAQAQHGVAHFLFHGPHLNLRPLTRQACVEVAAEARGRGMPWWTAEQINTWERARRGVRLQIETVDGGWRVSAHSSVAMVDAALVLALPDSVQPADAGATVRPVHRHGHEFIELGVNLPAGTSTWLLHR